MTEESVPMAAAPGWYDDPDGNGSQRYWDGDAWTDGAQAAPTPAATRAAAPPPSTAPPEVPNGQPQAVGEVQPPAPAPVPAAYGVVHCRGCGAPLNPQAAICVNCGVATGAQPQQSPADPKNKTTSVLLAVFLGLWTWLYTYKRDSWKFWLNLGLSIVTVGIWFVIAWVWAIIDVAIRPTSWYESFPNSR